jgi:hypothetical protein
MIGNECHIHFGNNTLSKKCSIQGCLERVEAYQEKWGSYIRIEGWAFDEKSEIIQVKAWVENTASKTSPISRWFWNTSSFGKWALLTHGSSRPDLVKTVGSGFAWKAGFYGLITLSKEQSSAKKLTLWIRII